MHGSPPDFDLQIAASKTPTAAKAFRKPAVAGFDRKSALGAGIVSTCAHLAPNFRLKTFADRRIVQASAPLGWPTCEVQVQWDVPPCSCSSGKAPRNMLFDLCLSTAVVGRQLEGRSLSIEEIGYGQQ